MKLKTNPANPRTITKDAYDKLKRSIERNPDGLTANKIAHKDGIIISGNQRYRAIQELKLDMKPEWFKDLSGWTQEQITEWVIQSNLSAGEWDWDELANGDWLATDLNDWGLDTTQEWDNKKELPETIDDIPEPPKDPITKLGDIWLLGNHRVICGDSTDKATVEKLMDGKKADMVFTDPPYGVDYEGVNNDHLKKEELRKFIFDALKLVYENLREGSNAYIWHPDVHAYEFIGAFRDAGFTQAKPAIIQWLKDSLVMSQGDYHLRNEPCLYGWKAGKNRQRVKDRTQDTIWEYPKPRKAEGHPTMKPVALCVRAINNSSKKNESILDSFLGSGSTLIACEQTDRLCYGLELDPHYVDVICKRWQTLTGTMPILESTGEAHDFIG